MNARAVPRCEHRKSTRAWITSKLVLERVQIHCYRTDGRVVLRRRAAYRRGPRLASPSQARRDPARSRRTPSPPPAGGRRATDNIDPGPGCPHRVRVGGRAGALSPLCITRSTVSRYASRDKLKQLHGTAIHRPRTPREICRTIPYAKSPVKSTASSSGAHQRAFQAHSSECEPRPPGAAVGLHQEPRASCVVVLLWRLHRVSALNRWRAGRERGA